MSPKFIKNPKQGRKEGREEEKEEIVLNLYSSGMSIEEISQKAKIELKTVQKNNQWKLNINDYCSHHRFKK